MDGRQLRGHREEAYVSSDRKLGAENPKDCPGGTYISARCARRIRTQRSPSRNLATSIPASTAYLAASCRVFILDGHGRDEEETPSSHADE